MTTPPYATMGRVRGTTVTPVHAYPWRHDPMMCLGDQQVCLHLQNDTIDTPLEMWYSTDGGHTWIFNGLLDQQNATQEFRQTGELWRLVDQGLVLAEGMTAGRRVVLRAGMFSDVL